MSVDEIPYKEWVLEIVRREAEIMIDERGFQLMGELEKVDILRHSAGELVLRLSTRCASEKREGETVSYPADWWEHFKLRWFPYSWKRRWPVKWRHVDVNFRVFYPDIKLPPNAGTHVVFAELNNDWLV